MADDRLYGQPGAEWLHNDLDDAVEAAFEELWEPSEPGEPLIIEEWTVRPTIDHLPTADHIVDWVIEWAADCGESVEDQFDIATTDDMRAAAVALQEAIAAQVKVQAADRRVARHIVAVTLDDDGLARASGYRREDLAES